MPKIVELENKKIAFIINKGSGNVLKKVQKIQLKEYILQHTDYPVFEPENAEESARITRELVDQNYEAVFACGGDGTLNTVSSQLVNTNTALGVIPFGSGNGFARYHKIPLRWQKAFNVHKNHKEIICDACTINGKHFVNVAGIGYSGNVAKAFKQEKGRGFWGYVKVILKNLHRDNRNVKITSDTGESWEGSSWDVEFANGTQWGADVYVAPYNKMDDNIIEVIAFKEISIWVLPFLALRMLLNLSKGSRYIARVKGQKVTVEYNDILPIQIDGDFAGKAKEKVEVECLPRCIKVWVPN